MFLERRGDESRQQAGEKIMVGYDLKNSYAQISYLGSGMEEPETAALITGTEVYNIPAVLCKRYKVNQWYFGREALQAAKDSMGTLVTDILEHALAGDTIEVEDESYEATALLTLFVRRSLSLLGLVCSPEKIDSLMFTVDDLSDKMVEVLGTVSANLGLKKATVYFQSHMESLYHFVLNQPKELWAKNVYVCDFDGVTMTHYMFGRNLRTTPIVTLIEKRVTENIVISENPEDMKLDYLRARLDEQFLAVLQEQTAGQAITSAYLLGDGFREQWMTRSLQYLCKNRRGFLGNNLFSKGACYGLRDKANPGEDLKRHVYLGPDKLKANLGTNVIRAGAESYYALLDAGINWYEIDKTYSFYAPEDGKIEMVITPLDGKNKDTKFITLDEIPERPGAATLLQMHLTMKSANVLRVVIEDKGFGEIYPATEKNWEEEIVL